LEPAIDPATPWPRIPVVWAPPSRKVKRDAPPSSFRVGRPVTWAESGRANRPRAARVVAGAATRRCSARPRGIAAVSASEPKHFGLALACRARVAQVTSPLAWPPACPKQEPRKTMRSFHCFVLVRNGRFWSRTCAGDWCLSADPVPFVEI
jgi:hypothetical protein